MSLDATLGRQPSPGSALRKVRAHLTVPLFRNGYSLIASTLITSAFGVVFWTVAARRYPAASVGIDAALISAMTLIAGLAHLNLTNALNRFVPSAGRASARLIAGAYTVAGGLALVAATVFVLGARWWSPSLDDLQSSSVLAVTFVAATVAWVLFQLQDSALTGLGSGTTVLGENLCYAVAKIVILVALAAGWAHGVFVAWIAPLVPAVVVVNLLVFRRFVPAHIAREPAVVEPPRAAAVGRFIAADYAGSLLWTAAISLQPLLVLALVGPEAGAYAYMAWTIGYALYLVSVNMGMSLITEASREPARLQMHVRGALARTYCLLVPAVAVTAAAAPLVLRMFGADYASASTTLLRLLAVSAIPYAVVATFLAVARVQKRMRAVLAVNASVSIPAVALMFVMLPRWGIVGMGYAWLTSLLVVAVVLLVSEFRPLVLTSLNVGRLNIALRPLRQVMSRRRRQTAHSEVGRALGTADGEWRLVNVATNRNEVAVAAVEAVSGDRRAILRVSTNPTGLRTLERHRRGLETIAAFDALGPWRTLVPRVIASGENDGRRWMLEERMGGHDGRSFVQDPELPALLTAAATSIGMLHGASAVVTTIDSEMFERWVGRPLDQVAALPRAHMREAADRATIERLRGELAAVLVGRGIVTAYTHGDFWLGNLLLAGPSTPWVVTGIVDWEQAAPGRPGALDVAHLLLTTRACQRHQELGAVVARFLHGEPWTPWERAILTASIAAGTDPMAPRALVLVTWLHHISAGLAKAERNRHTSVWTAANIDRVLEAV